MMFPGQLPAVRKETNNLVYPVDPSSRKDVVEVVETLQALVKRKVPVRIGLVPVASGESALDHAKVLYYLTKTYGLAASMKYLQRVSDDRALRRIFSPC